jgi:glutaconate CoA-transferase, subunit A
VPERTSKLTSLPEACRLVRDGTRLALGGFAVYQHPIAFAHELVRQGRRDLTLVGVVNGIEADLLIGAGCVTAIETSYVGLEKHGLARNFRRFAEQGRLEVVDYPELLSWDRFRASQENLPFWPASFLGGNDVVRFNPKIKPFACPLTGRPMHAVPPADPDVVVIHALMADAYGNVLIPSRRLIPQSHDITLARSCDTVIVTAERIVETETIKRHPHLNEIPSFRTTCVVHLPFGAHPTVMVGLYRGDDAHMREYLEASASDDAFAAYLERYVHGPADHQAYLERVGLARLLGLLEVDVAL